MVVNEKSKRRKKCVMKRKIKFEDYKNCLKAAQIENKLNHLEKDKMIWIFIKKL